MIKIFKTGLLSFLSCAVLTQSAFIGYSTEIKENSYVSENKNTSFYLNDNNSDNSSAEITENDINDFDAKKDYTDGLNILESAEVSDEFAKNNDPLYKKYMESPAIAKVSTKKYGVTEPTTPAALEGLGVVDGIDVSMYQAYSTPIDWNKVKAAGISYAIIRCGYRGWGTGEIVADSYFKQNIEGALAAGLQVGVYFYTQAITATEAREEADFCKNAVKGYNITLPIYIDIEFADAKGRLDSKKLSKASKTNLCKAFANRVQSAGYTGGVYANKSWLETEIDGNALANKYAIWLAHYTTNTTYAGEFSMWQYSSKATISGIKGSVDINKNYLSKPHKVTGLTASDSAKDPSEFILSWNHAAGAYKYQVKVLDESTSTWVSLGTTRFNTMTITGLTTSKEKQYKVRAFKLIGTDKIYGSYSSAVTYSAPLNKARGFTQTAATTTSVSIKWNIVPDAAGYYINMYNQQNQQWEQIKTISGNSNVTAKITGLDYSTIYKFRVQGYTVEADGTITPLINSAVLNTATSPKKSSGLKYTKIGSKTIKLTWKKLDRVSGYQILKYNSSKKQYSVCATVSGQSKNTAAIKNLKSGTTYKFKVQGYKTANKTKWTGTRSTVYSISTTPSKVTKLKYSFKGSKCTLSWKSCTGAQGYQIQKYNTATKKWKTVKTIKSKKITKYKFSLAKKKSAKFRIRAYKTIKSKKRYGSFSANKNIKHK